MNTVSHSASVMQLAQKTAEPEILIVDDDNDDHLFLKLALREVMPSARVRSLYDGNEALRYLRDCQALPLLVFMDLNMRCISGKAATRLIRANPRLDKVPVIILSTSSIHSEREELMGIGANDYYTKPCSVDHLIRIVSAVKNNWLGHEPDASPS